MSNNFSCIVLAGGVGRRFGSAKQFEFLDHHRLWERVLETAEQVCDDIVVVGIDVPPGEHRQGSVRNGLKAVHTSRVVILESARPLVTAEQITTIAAHQDPSVSYALSSVETIYDKTAGKFIPRKRCLSIQVPQAFDTQLLMEAHEIIPGGDATDDTQMMYIAHGISPTFIAGGPNLFKITHPSDLVVARALKEFFENA